MANLRILNINAADSRIIKVRFSDPLALDIGSSNIQILSEIFNIPDIEIVSVSVLNDILIINTLPHTPYSRYNVIFSSTNSVIFRSLDETKFLLEDSRNNTIKILGAENDYNPTRSTFIDYLGGQDSVYDLSRESNVRKYLNQISDMINKCRYDIGQAKNANYLELLIQDERKVRRYGPWDRLNQEGAFEVVRVGREPTNTSVSTSMLFNSFPSDPISLQSETITSEELVLGIGKGTYDDLVLTLNRYPVIKLNSVQIKYSNGDVFDYEIRSYGYQIQDPKYDTSYARRYVTLEDNQIKLSDNLKSDPDFVLPGGEDTIVASYDFKFLGKIIGADTVEVVEVIEVVRECAPALSVVFSLQNAPVVTSGDVVSTDDGVEFLDPYSVTPFLNTHPAFSVELPYREGGLPARPGEYAVDYETGRVYVYGAVNNDGTGDFPPVMNYYSRKTYSSRLDYTYVEEFIDVVASPLRYLVGKTAKINYNYELTFVPGIDYEANVHLESRNERIENRLVSLDSFYTEHSPITDVFRIYNETTGEIYSLRRFTDNKVFFDSRTPPRIGDIKRERAEFTNVFSEQLILEEELTNLGGVRVLKIRLQNQNIIGSTDDVIGSSFNSSVNFSDTDIFSQEIYYDSQELTEDINIDRLRIGFYQINYREGIIYIGVSNSQNLNLGTINYKKPTISPQNSHVISVSELYTSINANFGVSLLLNYESFDEGEIVPTPLSLYFSDERYTDNNPDQPYIYDGNQIVLTNDIKSIRGIYDAYDLNNNDNPVNFAESATFEANIITLDSIGISKTEQLTVDGDLKIIVTSIAPEIEIGTVNSILRISDGYSFTDSIYSITENTIWLDGYCGVVAGDIVTVLYTIVMQGGATPIVDYNKGDLFIDYSYLLDEILVTYEWGDNVIDFRQSRTLIENDVYYVTYKVGALRNSLTENFGSLVQIEELQVFDEELDREVYRDILQGALQTFTQGPTVAAMKQLVASVTHIDPRIRESEFWSLSVSYLNKVISEFLGDTSLAAGVFDYGVSIVNSGDGVTLPISNNLRLEEGTLELSIIPNWDGLDNDATLTFELYRDGYSLESSDIFIGANSFNPEVENGIFSLNRNDIKNPEGVPAAIFSSSVGVFVYYDPDNKQWKILAKDIPESDGYTYSGTITTSGEFYDVKFIPSLGEETDVLRSGIKSLEFEFRLDGYDLISPDGYSDDSLVTGYSFDGIQFMSDDNHYLFDFGTNENQNRFSLYKDGRGYLVFEVWDRGGFANIQPDRRSVYQVSADVQDWKAGQIHNIAISWILNSSDRRDEMHLFLDGLETPNNTRYGNIPSIVSTERFRTIVPEQVVGVVPAKSIVGLDLVTVQGDGYVHSSTINFQSQGIVPSNTIEILEQGFNTYTILSVNNYTLQLSSPMPATLNNARFSVNPYPFIVNTEIDIYKNIGVFILSDGYETEIPGTRADIPSYSIERNALNQRILKILGNAEAGDIVLIKTFGLNHRRCRDKSYLWSDGSILKTNLPSPINLDDVIIRPIILPLIPIGPDNSIFIDGYYLANLNNYSQPSTSLIDGYHFDWDGYLPNEGRILEVRITGDNVDLISGVNVTINGLSSVVDGYDGYSESLIFNSPIKQFTQCKWMEISSIIVQATPIDGYSLSDGYLNSTAIEIKEKYSITEPNGNNYYPVIRYAYTTQFGLNLEGDGYDIVSDLSGFFSIYEVGHLLEITSPSSIKGIYIIEEVIDSTSIRLDRVVGTAFSGVTYTCYNISIGRSGFQNGFFFLELAGFYKAEYKIPTGWYEFDYATYLEVSFNPLDQVGIIGNDVTLQKPARAIIDEFRILNRQLTDTRIGESISINDYSITTDANKVSPFVKNSDTLVLFNFDSLPLINNSDVYKFANKEYIQSGRSVNTKFGHSIVIKNKGLVFNNEGLLDTSNEGLIEFWISPRFDTYNDPNIRIYFDAAANVVEEVTSITKGKVKVSGRIGEVVYVRLVSDTKLRGTDYFNGGSFDTDGNITLKTSLPFQNTPVKVTYIPTNVQGDRIVISKDGEGFICLTVTAQGKEFQTRQPIFWPRDSWHRVRASFKFNTTTNLDELRLFIDGEEKGVILFGEGDLLFGQGLIWGQSAIGGVTNKVYIADINFTDTIMKFSLGQDYAGNFGAEARFDNLKISNRSIDPLIISGQPIDVYFNTNTEFIYPSVEDAFTTFLFDFDSAVEKTEDFSVVQDPVYGIFKFDIDIIDSFNIVTGDQRIRTVLEALIYALKPAVSKVGIHYIT